MVSCVARSKRVCMEWMEGTVLFCRDFLREKEIYIHLVYALMATPRTPRWRRPTRPARLTTETRSPRNKLPSWIDSAMMLGWVGRPRLLCVAEPELRR